MKSSGPKQIFSSACAKLKMNSKNELSKHKAESAPAGNL